MKLKAKYILPLLFIPLVAYGLTKNIDDLKVGTRLNVDSATADTVPIIDGSKDVVSSSVNSTELGQLANIDSTTISATQWGYLGAMDQGVATTDNVQFAEGEFTDPLTLNHETTPANPASGKNKLYFKNDNLLYILDSTGTETSLGGIGTLNLTSLDSTDSPYTVLATDKVVLIDGVSDDMTINLPTAVGNDGLQYFIKRTDDIYIDNQDFADGDVTTGTDNLNITSHGFADLQKVQVSNSGGALPTGLSAATDYWVILVDASNIKLASSRANAVSDTAVDITAAAGGGTHTVEVQANTVTIDGDGSETIDGDTTFGLFTKNETLSLVSDGANWQVLEHRTKTGLVKFVPVFTGLGTPTNVDFWWTRQGDEIFVRGTLNVGTATATPPLVSLPNGMTLDTGKLGAQRRDSLGKVYGQINSTSQATPADSRGPFDLIYRSGQDDILGIVARVDLGADASGTFWQTENATANFSTAGAGMTIEYRVPISDWK